MTINHFFVCCLFGMVEASFKKVLAKANICVQNAYLKIGLLKYDNGVKLWIWDGLWKVKMLFTGHWDAKCSVPNQNKLVYCFRYAQLTTESIGFIKANFNNTNLTWIFFTFDNKVSQ